MKKTREIRKLYGNRFITSYILTREIEFTFPLHCLQKKILSTYTLDISEHFNNVFTSIGQDLQKNISPAKRHFLNYLKVSNTDTFDVSPTTPKDISDLIKTLKNSNSLGLNSIPTNMLKEIHGRISVPLSTLINKSFTTGVFPNMCKIAKVVPIFKSETRLLCKNYILISLLPNIRK